MKIASTNYRTPFRPEPTHRPVSLLPVISQIAERHISNLLKPQIEPLLPSDQFGFRPKRSTEDALLVFEQ